MGFFGFDENEKKTRENTRVVCCIYTLVIFRVRGPRDWGGVILNINVDIMTYSVILGG